MRAFGYGCYEKYPLPKVGGANGTCKEPLCKRLAFTNISHGSATHREADTVPVRKPRQA